MTLLILITGKQGSGKSHIAQEWARSNQAKHVDIDRVLVAGGPEIPDSAGRDFTSWDLWRTASPEVRERCLRVGLTAKYGGLDNYSGNLVVEGAILCNNWFFDSLRAALKVPTSGDSDVYCFYVNASNKTILRRVHARADQYPKRRGHEKLLFPTADAVANAHRGFDQAVGEVPGRWIEIHSVEDLAAELQRRRR